MPTNNPNRSWINMQGHNTEKTKQIGERAMRSFCALHCARTCRAITWPRTDWSGMSTNACSESTTCFFSGGTARKEWFLIELTGTFRRSRTRLCWYAPSLSQGGGGAADGNISPRTSSKSAPSWKSCTKSLCMYCSHPTAHTTHTPSVCLS